jgi:hypothetical protein
LACFFDEPEDAVERNKLIRAKASENERIKTFGRLSERELKEELARKEKFEGNSIEIIQLEKKNLEETLKFERLEKKILTGFHAFC